MASSLCAGCMVKQLFIIKAFQAYEGLGMWRRNNSQNSVSSVPPQWEPQTSISDGGWSLDIPFVSEESWFLERSRLRASCDICNSVGRIDMLRDEQSTSKTWTPSSVRLAMHLQARPSASLRHNCGVGSSAEVAPNTVTSINTASAILKSNFVC
jgi:hypothetical protein